MVIHRNAPFHIDNPTHSRIRHHRASTCYLQSVRRSPRNRFHQHNNLVTMTSRQIHDLMEKAIYKPIRDALNDMYDAVLVLENTPMQGIGCLSIYATNESDACRIFKKLEPHFQRHEKLFREHLEELDPTLNRTCLQSTVARGRLRLAELLLPYVSYENLRNKCSFTTYTAINMVERFCQPFHPKHQIEQAKRLLKKMKKIN